MDKAIAKLDEVGGKEKETQKKPSRKARHEQNDAVMGSRWISSSSPSELMTINKLLDKTNKVEIHDFPVS